METMQDRVNRETPPAPGGRRRWISYLVALVLAAGVGLGAHMALADTATPAGDGFTATSSSVSFKLSPIATVTCTGSSMSSTVPVPPNNPTPAGLPVCGPITIPTFTGCSATAGAVTLDATLTANGSWSYCLSNTGTGQLIIPKNSIAIVAGPCRGTFTPDGPVTISGTWTNGTSATSPNPAKPLSKLAFTNVNVPVTTAGGFPCPSAVNAILSATFEVADTTNPSAAILIGP